MRRSICLAAMLLAMAQAAGAQQFSSDPAVQQVSTSDQSLVDQEIEQLKARLAALENNRGAMTDFAGLASQQPGMPAPAVESAACEPAGQWVGGASLYVLKPHWSTGNPALLTQDFSTPTLNITTTNFGNGYQVAPAGWFGYVNSSGYGVRANFFQLNQSASSSGTSSLTTAVADPYFFLTPFPGTTLTATSSLAINYWDLEATKTVQAWDWNWTASAGLRYLYLNQTYQAQTLFNSLSTRQFFNGVGPTMSLQGRRPIGGRGLGFYGGGRGSLLFGKSPQSFFVTNSGFGTPLSVSSSTWGVMPVAELEFGVDYRRPLGRSTLVWENGLIGQAYFGAGSASGVSTNASSSSVGFFAPQSNATLGLFGLRSSISLMF